MFQPPRSERGSTVAALAEDAAMAAMVAMVKRMVIVFVVEVRWFVDVGGCGWVLITTVLGKWKA